MESALSDVPADFKDLLVLLPSEPPFEEGSWFGGFALQGRDGNLYLIAGRLLLLSRGVEIPDLRQGRFVERPGVFVVATTHLTDVQTIEVLNGFAQQEVAPPLQAVLGGKVLLPQEKQRASSWHTDSSKFRSHGGMLASTHAYRTGGGELSGFVNKGVFERADTALKFIEEPLQGLDEFVKRLRFSSHPGEFKHINNARPIVEVGAQLPLRVETFAYDTKAGGYRARIYLGAKLPRPRLRLSVTGPIKLVRALSHADWRVVDGDGDNALVVEYVIPSDHKKQDLHWSFALDEEILGEGVCPKRDERDFFSLAVLEEEEQTIRLPYGEWVFNPHKKLGNGGGSGHVYEGHDSLERPLAIKQLKTEEPELSRREVEVARGLVNHAWKNVIPILDAGFDQGSQRAYIVMARAQQNLQEFIEVGGATPESQAIPILNDILSGLEELGDIIHRDLKPANVLFHEGRWKLADLGTTRLSNAVTSTHTAKHFKTSLYAAPEQWSGARATKATDVYAFGCVMYALLNGEPPFSGSDEELYRKHSFELPQTPLKGSASLKALALRCLSKIPDSRPTLQGIRGMLAGAMQADSDEDPIVAATEWLANELSAKQLKEEQSRRAQYERERSVADALIQMRELLESFFQDVLQKGYGLATRVVDGIQFGEARFVFRELDFVVEEAMSKSGWDVRKGIYIAVFWRRGDEPHRALSANVWYAKRPSDSACRWWEVSYVENPLVAGSSQDPFGIESASLLPAAAAAMAGNKDRLLVREEPVAADFEDAQAFLKRWRKRLAEAAQGVLNIS